MVMATASWMAIVMTLQLTSTQMLRRSIMMELTKIAMSKMITMQMVMVMFLLFLAEEIVMMYRFLSIPIWKRSGMMA